MKYVRVLFLSPVDCVVCVACSLFFHVFHYPRGWIVGYGGHGG